MNFRTKEITKIVGIAEKLSTLRERTHASSYKVFYTEEIFNKFVLHLMSFEHSLQTSYYKNFVDVSVLAAIARMIIEIHNAVHYFSDRTISKDEMEFRIWLYNLHSYYDQAKIFDKLLVKDKHLNWSEFGKDLAVEELKNNVYFKSLTESKQRTLLKGQKAFYWRGARSKRSPLPKHIEEGIYKLLSNFVHSFPIGNTMYRGIHSTNSLSFANSSFLIVETVVCYSASTINAYCALRWKLAKRLTKQEREYLKSVIAENNINLWILEKNKNSSPF